VAVPDLDDDDRVQIHFPDNVENANPGQIVRAFRLIEYCGPKEWVASQLLNSIQGRKSVGADRWIEGKTIIGHEFYTELDVCVDQIRKALARTDDGRQET
jgi:hypothetical protein